MNDEQGDIYVLGHSDEEHRRLQQQARAWEAVTPRILKTAGVEAGMHCLDVGCGVGEGMRILGTMVGPNGKVTGIDLDSSLKQGVLERLRREVNSTFEFIEGNIEKLDTVEGAPFDVIYLRLLLIHLSDPVAALRKLYGWLRPGGIIVLQDYDMRTVDIAPELPAFDEFRHTFYGAFQKIGLDIQIGQKIPLHMIAAGLGEPDGTDVAGRLENFSGAWTIIKAGYISVLPVALKFGLTTEAKSQQFLAEMDRIAADGQYRASYWPMFVSAWKRKEK